jgi:hypothetical protein
MKRSQEEKDRICQMVADGMTFKAVGEVIGLTHWRIRKIVSRQRAINRHREVMKRQKS